MERAGSGLLRDSHALQGPRWVVSGGASLPGLWERRGSRRALAAPPDLGCGPSVPPPLAHLPTCWAQSGCPDCSLALKLCVLRDTRWATAQRQSWAGRGLGGAAPLVDTHLGKLGWAPGRGCSFLCLSLPRLPRVSTDRVQKGPGNRLRAQGAQLAASPGPAGRSSGRSVPQQVLKATQRPQSGWGPVVDGVMEQAPWADYCGVPPRSLAPLIPWFS